MHICIAPTRSGQRRPRLEVADIFRDHGEAYRKSHLLTDDQLKVMWGIPACRTSVLGGHRGICSRCSRVYLSYNSCRNRHCPKCQCLTAAQWVEQQSARILPTDYFHVVFTVPHELNALAHSNRWWFLDLLFSAASRTLLQLGKDPNHLGAQIGFTAVLHTWTRRMLFHPHLHCIVTGGGLSADLQRWVPGNSKYLFPLQVMGQLFRGKFLDAVAKAWKRGELDLAACPHLADKEAFAEFKDQLYRKSWIVDARKPFAGPRQVFGYLGRYTHRVAISNQRLLSVDRNQVRFWTKGHKVVSLTPTEFIRRFLLHILPHQFVKIRHYGLMAPGNVNTRCAIARRILAPNPLTAPQVICLLVLLAVVGLAKARPKKPDDWQDRYHKLTGINLKRCPVCQGTIKRHRFGSVVLSVPEPWDTS